MAVYRRQRLTGLTPPDVSLAPLRGGRIAKQNRFHAVHRGVDKITAMGRRIVLTQCAAGSDTWQADSSTVSATLNRLVAQGRHDLAPGNVLALSVLHLPSGDSSSGAGPLGEVQLDITWTDADGSSTARTYVLPLVNGPDQLDEPWGGIKVRRIPKIEPATLSATDTLRDWSRHTHCEITASYNGNPRILDVCVHEIPAELALEEDDADDYWVSSFFHNPTPEGTGPGLQYPIQRFSETTPDGNRLWGTYSLMDAVNAQAVRLGPQLVSWSGHSNEGDSNTNSDDAYQLFDASLSNWARVGDGATETVPTTLTADDQYGWSFSSGAYGKPVSENPDASMGNTGSIPVRVYALISADDPAFTENFALRIYTAPYSYVEITGTAGVSKGWHTCYGHLKCGKGPGDFVKGTAILRRTQGNGDVRLYALRVFRSEQYTPAA